MKFLYAAAFLWLFLAWRYVDTMLPGHLNLALFIGLPPLVILAAVHMMARKSL